MSTNLQISDGRCIAVMEPLSEVMEIIEERRRRDPDCFYPFKLAKNTNEKRYIRINSIVEYRQGHSK